MDNASKEALDRQQQYKLSLLRGQPDESLLRSESQSETLTAGGAGKITQCNLIVTPPAEEKQSELRGSKDKGSRRNRRRKQ